MYHWRELNSLIGLLQHARQVLSLVTPSSKGWLIYWALHNWRTTTHTWTKGLQQFIMVADLNAITEWYAFPQRVEFEFDTSGSWGRSAWWETEWLQFQWPRQAMEHHYHLPWAMYIVAMMLCGPQWQGQLVHVWCNNQAAVQGILARSCKDSGFMHLLQFLWFMEATFPFQMSASHIPGVNNTLARFSLPQ